MTLKYYLYSYSCYFWSMNIFGYSFGKYVALTYIRIFVWYIMWHLNIFRYLFVSILCYLLITGACHLRVNERPKKTASDGAHTHRQIEGHRDSRTESAIFFYWSISWKGYSVSLVLRILLFIPWN